MNPIHVAAFQEHIQMEDKLSESHHQMSMLMEENEELHTRIREQQAEIQQEREVNAQVGDSLLTSHLFTKTACHEN